MSFNKNAKDQESRKVEKLNSQIKKNPSLAASLSFFMPGLGQGYIGNIFRAILGIFAILFGCAFIGAGIAFDSPVPVIMGGIWLAIFWFYTIFVAHKAALRINNELDNISDMKKKGFNENPLDLIKKAQGPNRSGKDNEAIEAFNRAIISNFYSRGVFYRKIGDIKNAINDFKVAANLGHSISQEFLKSKNISW